MNYTVRFFQTIWNKKDTDNPPMTRLNKILIIPFVPFVGLEVFDDNFQTLKPVSRVVWDVKQSSFSVYLPEDFSLRENENLPAMDRLDCLSEVIAFYKSFGWEDVDTNLSPSGSP
jgi:hypothetical protein